MTVINRSLKPAGVQPSGTILISENGDYDVTNYAQASVNVQGGSDVVKGLVERSITTLTAEDLNGVTKIGNNAFSGCVGLTSITIPSSVTSIGQYAFSGCSKLVYNLYDNAKYLGNEENPYQAAILPLSSSITSCIVNENCKAIADGMFYYCQKLSSVTLGNNITSIGNQVFQYCNTLTSINIPSSVTSIGNNAFSNCTGLTKIIIPSSVNSIGYEAFSGCSKLTSITIPDSVINIGDGAFRFCTDSTSITIGTGVKTIGECAFERLNNLTEINYDAIDISDVRLSTFRNSGSAGTGITVNIGDGVKRVPKIFGASQKSEVANIALVNFGNSVEEIGDYAFRYCDKLTSITIPDSVINIGDGAFQDCSGLTSISLSERLTSIGYSAFSGCSGLTEITIPSNVTSIGYYAFTGCDGLTSVTYQGQVPNIQNGTFTGCTSVTKYNFRNCTTVPSLYNTASLGHASGCQIIIPDVLYDTWTTATNWVALTDVTFVKASEV